jgi:hypothetical protein
MTVRNSGEGTGQRLPNAYVQNVPPCTNRKVVLRVKKEVTTMTDGNEEGGVAKDSNECDSCQVLLKQD